MSQLEASVNLLKKLEFIKDENDLGSMSSINIKMIARIARRHSWLRDRISKMSANGGDASWDKSEMSALGWAVETLIGVLSKTEPGNSI